MERRGGELRLALRTTLAGLITFALAELLNLPQGYWAVLTSVIIMQGSVGGSLKAGIDRLIGSFAGAIWGVAVTLAIPHHGIPALGLALVVALGPLALVSALKPSFRIAPVTAIIVLLSTSSLQADPVPYAVDRVLEIGLGCIIGLAVSLLILPGRAARLLAEAAAVVLRGFAELVELLLRDVATPLDRPASLAIHGRLRRAMTRVETLAGEAKHERVNRLSDAPDPEPVLRNLRRLNHDLTAVGRAVMSAMPAQGRQHLGEPRECAAPCHRRISDGSGRRFRHRQAAALPRCRGCRFGRFGRGGDRHAPVRGAARAERGSGRPDLRSDLRLAAAARESGRSGRACRRARGTGAGRRIGECRGMTEIYVDADACPVREEVYRVAERLGLQVHVVFNGSRPILPPNRPNVRLVVVGDAADAADDWIAERITSADICVTADIPLASRCLAKDARAIAPNGKVWTKGNIGQALAGRELSRHLRELGVGGGGPPPFSKSDRSRFLSALDTELQALLRQSAAKG